MSHVTTHLHGVCAIAVGQYHGGRVEGEGSQVLTLMTDDGSTVALSLHMTGGFRGLAPSTYLQTERATLRFPAVAA